MHKFLLIQSHSYFIFYLNDALYYIFFIIIFIIDQ